MNEHKEKAAPLSPAMRRLMNGGATALFHRQAIPLKQGVEAPHGQVQTATLPILSGSPAARPVRLLGQQQTPMPTQVRPGTPQTPAPAAFRKCPGPIEMPDGRILEPDDYLRLNDFCELMPFLLEAMGQAVGKGLAPGQRVTVVGGQQTGMQAISGLPGFGPAQGPGGGGGGGFPSGGGGPGPVGPPGPTGPAGPAGASGVGVLTSPVVKTDGDFTAGAAAAFAAVPGTLLSFTTTQDGPVAIFVQAELVGSGLEGAFMISGQLGLRIDGADQKLARLVVDGNAALAGQSQMFSLDMVAGIHTVEVLLRGLLPGEYGVGSGISATVSANPESPLVVVALHR